MKSLQTSPIKPSDSISHELFDQIHSGFDGSENCVGFEKAKSFQLPDKKPSNNYVCQWLDYKNEFLETLLDMAAPPDQGNAPHEGHQRHLFHRIRQWTGSFFDKSSLNLAGFELHLSHARIPCPVGAPPKNGDQDVPLLMNDNEWEDMDQDNLRTAFTFNVLNDFIWDNLEYGTSGLNYVFQQAPQGDIQCISPLGPGMKLRLLKLLKWNGFGHQSWQPKKGELALFCPAFPQPGINCNPFEDNFSGWRYSQAFIMDGNFKAKHMHEKQPGDQVWLMDGLGYMVIWPDYQEYLKLTHYEKKVNVMHISATCDLHATIIGLSIR
ncbi:hypothetical protein HD554DRAFT_2040400 [Boletus coccyginus]|nr:hypothetical protein HD554DRAFT_2040400 [Boletus coccyginus]